MTETELREVLHNLDKKLTALCGNVQHLKESHEEFKANQVVNKNKIDEAQQMIIDKFDVQHGICLKRAKETITWPTFKWLVGILTFLIFTSYAYTTGVYSDCVLRYNSLKDKVHEHVIGDLDE